MRIGILGATGPAGSGLAARLASVGHEVLYGSRRREKAVAGVAALREQWGERVDGLTPVDNAGACDAPVVVLAVSAAAAVPTLEDHAAALDGKVVLSMTNHLARRGDEFNAVLPARGSVAAELQARAPAARVVAAFHLVPAAELAALDRPMGFDVVACGDDDEARAIVMGLIRDMPDLRAFDGGSLANAVGIEAFAAVLLTVNVRHHVRAGLRLVGRQ